MKSTSEFTLSARLAVASIAAVIVAAGITSRAIAAGDLVIRTVAVRNEDPAAAGKEAAAKLREAMGQTPLKAVIVSECFEDRDNKAALLAALSSSLPKEIIFGAATYGSFTQKGCTDFDSVCLMGLGGEGISVNAQLARELGTAKLTVDKDKELIAERLHKAGASLANSLGRTDRDRLLLVLADAHSPKNQFLMEGLQLVLGNSFPITGGCANKNAGQTFVYFRGELHDDSAVAIMLSGDFRAALAGRQANVNDLVISTARDAAKEVLKSASGEPVAVFAFNCAGRRSKLKKYEDELQAIQDSLGKQTELFGCYCAGEMGPVDDPQQRAKALCGGAGWHVMFTVITKN